MFLYSSFIIHHVVTTKRCNNPISTKATDQYTGSSGQWTSIHNTRQLCPSTGGLYGFHLIFSCLTFYYNSMQLCSIVFFLKILFFIDNGHNFSFSISLSFCKDVNFIKQNDNNLLMIFCWTIDRFFFLFLYLYRN